ncbi:MAG TPA: hypothetical protein VE621_14680 [Bryobacteraceae bacterium]|nr:hypothetical protein [Bryobacteraceae bacterium]
MSLYASNVSLWRFAAICLFLISAIFVGDGAPADGAPKLPAREKALITEAYSVWSAFADEIWPGSSKLKAPFLYVGEQHEYAVGFPRPLEGFTDTGDLLLGKTVQARKRTLAPDVSASFPIQGITAVVMGSPEALRKTSGGWIITAGHEMLHVFQVANSSYEKVADLNIGPKIDPSWHLTFPFPYQDADTMRLIHLQGYLVWLAAQSSSQDDAKYSIGTAVDAARVYRSHLARLSRDDKAYRYSQYQEWNEGVAAYFEYKLAEKAGASTYRPTKEYSLLPMFQSTTLSGARCTSLGRFSASTRDVRQKTGTCSIIWVPGRLLRWTKLMQAGRRDTSYPAFGWMIFSLL